MGVLPWQDKELEEYAPADIAMALTRMVSYNIGHLAYLNAKRYNLSRVFFGGFYIRGHPYTMETISFAIRFWSKVQRSCPLSPCIVGEHTDGARNGQACSPARS